MNGIKRIVLMSVSAIAAGAALTGCAGINVARQASGNLQARAHAEFRQSAPESRAVVVTHGTLWLRGEEIKASAPQPQILDKAVNYVPQNGKAPSLADLCAWIWTNTGVIADLDTSVRAQTAAAAPQAAKAKPAAVPFVVPAIGGAAAQGMPAAAEPGQILAEVARGTASADVEPFEYKGTLRGLLDVVAARYGVYWRYRDGQVTIFRTETKTFALPDLPSSFSFGGSISTSGGSGGGATMAVGADSTLSGGAASAGGSGGTGSQVSLKSGGVVDYWAGLQQTAESVGGLGTQVVVNRSLGMLIATGTPPQIKRVDDWVKGLSAMLSKQVAIEVRLYNVKLSREDNYGLNLSLAYHSANGHTGISFTGAQAPSISSSSTPMSFGATILDGTLKGTSAAVQALSALGNVSEVLETSGIARNGRAVGIQSDETKDYVNSSQTTLTSTVGATTTMQTASVLAGLTSTFVPRVVDGRILIDFNMQLSDLLPFSTFSSNGSSVQLKDVVATTLLSSVALKSGESLVMVGNRQRTASVNNNGVGDPGMALLGGGVDAQVGDTVLAVVITAHLL